MKKYFIIGLLCICAGFLRFQGLVSNYQFLGDQGRDARIMREMINGTRVQLVGPTMSLGGFYLGPLFYYLTAPSLLISQFNPVGPALFTAMIGVLTVILLYWCLKTFTSHTAALIAAIGITVDPTLVHFSRFAWNPNMIPLFVVIWLYAILSFWHTRSLRWWYVLAIVCAALIQLHYVTTLLLIPTLFVWKHLHAAPFSKKHARSLFIFILPSILSLSPILYTIWSKGMSGVLTAVLTPSTHAALQTHYFLFLIPLIYAVGAVGIARIYAQLPHTRMMIIISCTAAFLLLLQQSSSPALPPASVQPATRTLVVQAISQAAQGKPFQLAVLSQISNDEPYRYLFSLTPIQPVIAPQSATQLFIVCEDAESCKPYGNPHYEIARFAVEHLKQQQNQEILLTEPVKIVRIKLVE